MNEVLKELNLGLPQRDLFASSYNSRCKEFFGTEDDAMSKSWTGCLNWCNPPFAMLDQVTAKILEERPEVVIVVPDWQREKWFQKLREVATRQTFRACGVRVFEVEGKPTGQTRWGTWFFYIRPEEASVQVVVGEQRNLRIPVRVLDADKAKRLKALVDTGA